MANLTPYKYHGTVHYIGERMSFASGFAKRTVILCADPNAQYKDYAAFDFTTSSRSKSDNTAIPDQFRVGDDVEITFYTTANENRNKPGQWFASNRAIKMERSGAVRDLLTTEPEHATHPESVADEADLDDLPF